MNSPLGMKKVRIEMRLTTLHIQLDRNEKRLLCRFLDTRDLSLDTGLEIQFIIVIGIALFCFQLLGIELFCILSQIISSAQQTPHKTV